MFIKLYIAPGCPHCPNMIRLLGEMVKQGQAGRIEVINIALEPELAREAGIRSVPTFAIGEYRLTGVQTEAELLKWLEKSHAEDGLEEYLNQEFEQGQLDHIIEQVQRKTDWLERMIKMLASMETPLTSRIGISAVFENLQGSDLLKAHTQQICELADNEHESIRADMAYLLGLTENTEALPCLEKLASDDFADVAEAAHEAIETIRMA